MSAVKFTINGKEHVVSTTVEPDTSLNSYLRNYLNLRGTKAMCHEGGCGVCIVSVSAVHPVTKIPTVFSVNSCLVSIMSCHNWAITTIEGLGNKKSGYHPIQSRLAGFDGTQCGYCSPGWVMSMHSLHEKYKDGMTSKQVENSFAGNICRCTGYRPIMDAFKSFVKDSPPALQKKARDIEDLTGISLCKKTGLVCTKVCEDYSQDGEFCVVNAEIPFNDMVYRTEMLSLTNSDTTWYKVYNMKDLFKVFDREGTDSYMLVAGNTAQGVYHMDKLPKVMIDISSIAKLREFNKREASLILGANMTLNEMMELFQDVSKTKDYYSYTAQMYKHMDLVAHIPVRNIGTIAGNLSIKHQHNEFQSDVFLLFATIGAVLTIAEKNKKTSIKTLPDYLKTNMKGKVIQSIEMPPLDEEYVFQTYKIMPRAQNAHAHVNAGFLFKFNSDKTIVMSASIVYGGINPQFIHATSTETFLVGKNLFSNDVLKSAIQTLAKEIMPNEASPEPSIEYRKKLAIGLFYKCVLHIAPSALGLDIRKKSGGDEFDRGVSSGKQEFDTKKELWPLNQPVNKVEGVVQCSGEAKFVNDIPTLPNELYGAFVLSNVYNGNIDKIDASEVLAMKGVVAIYTAKDIPGKNNFFPLKVPFGAYVEEILCSDKILFHSQPVAVIVAETERLAKLVAKMVKVTYKNTTSAPPLLTIREVLKSPSAKDRVVKNRTIDAQSKGDDVDNELTGTFDIFGQYHYTMETQTCVCVPIEDGLDVFSSAQWMDLLNVTISETLNIPENSININIRRLGGGYGAKISRSSQIAAACALAATKLNRPVRFVLPIETNMAAVGKRLPCSADYVVAVNKEGKIQRMNASIYQDNGCSFNENMTMQVLGGFFNCYDFSTWTIEASSVLTDTPSNTWCRAPGSTEGVALIEQIMDNIATVTGLDPVQVRLSNMMPKDNPIPELIGTTKTWADYDERSQKVKDFNSANRWRKRGISVSPLTYPLEYWGNFSALVSIYYGDGTVAVAHGGIEMGQGINTKIAQVCAHSLGIKLDLVSIKPSNNLTAPNAITSGGSITSETCAYATVKACEILIQRLAPIKKAMGNPTWQELVNKAYFSGVDLCASYMFTVLDGVKTYNIFGVTITEVEVDLLTGNHQILRADIMEDAGESMSPNIDVGQVEGAYVMGIGYWTSENLAYDKKTGELLTTRTWTYKPPGVKDIPLEFRVLFRRNAPNPAGVLRSKATGEPPFNMSVGVISAIRQAITSARCEKGIPENEWYHIGIPYNTENIVAATGTNIEDFMI